MIQLQGWGVTDVGRVRSQNQDSMISDPELGLFFVCDGMGGMAAGDVASQLAVETIRETIDEHRARLAGIPQPAPRHDRAWVVDVLEAAGQAACACVYENAQDHPERKGMGTTMTGILAVGGRGFVLHVGDSRAYVLRQGKLHTLTEDHTVIQEMIKSGRVTPEQAKDLPYRGALSRAVGVQASVRTDRLEFQLCDGDRFLLCSDGLCNYADADRVQELLSVDPVSEVPQRAIDFANEAGGKDNITTVVFTVSTHREDPKLATATAEQFQLQFSTLREIPLFAALTDREVLKLMSAMDEHLYAAGETLMREGEPGEDFLVLLHGTAEVRKGGAAIAQVGRGGHIGEMALLDNRPRSATVVALEPTQAFVVQRARFLKLLKSDPGLSNKILWCFLHMLNDRLRTTSDDLSGAMSQAQRWAKVPNIFD